MRQPQLPINRFELRRRLGAGGMGVVYEAMDRERGSLVAVKILKENDPAALFRFKREFRELAALAHPHLIALYELHSIGDEWFFTMELVDGYGFFEYVRPYREGESPSDEVDTKTLSQHPKASHPRGQVVVYGSKLKASGARFDPERLRVVLSQVASALGAIHEHGLLHRDVKSSNVLVRRDGHAILCDFGLVKNVSGARGVTETHAVIGTAQYMSPEQAAGDPLSPASDWYSFGVMLYEALTGRLPFLGTPYDHITNKLTMSPLAPSQIEPDVPADLNQLCVALLERNPKSRPGYQEIRTQLAAPASRRRASFRPLRSPAVLGRELEKAALRDAFDRLAPSTGACAVLVGGESGMGKTALVRNFLEDVEARSAAVVLAGRCYERESVPFNGIDSVMDSLSLHLANLRPSLLRALLPPDVGLLARVFPVMRTLDTVVASIGVSPDPIEARRRTLAALKQLLFRIGEEQKIVLFIDDLQWADVDTAAALLELTRPPSPPVLLLASYRNANARSVQMLQRAPELGGLSCDVREIHLSALRHDDARQLAQQFLSLNEVSDIDCEQLVREAKGSPFFLQELVRHAQRPANRDDGSGPSLFGVFAARLQTLPEPARRMLEFVAVAARPVPQSIVRGAAALGNDEARALNLLRNEHLVRTSGASGSGEIETFHDYVRTHVVSELTPNELQDRHRKLALALVDAGSDDALALLEHFRGAGEPATAAKYAMLAGDQAAEAFGFERAAQLYRLALEMGVWTPEEERDARGKLGDALANSGRGGEAAAEYQLAADGDPNAGRALDLQRRAAEQLLRAGRIDEGMRVLTNVLAVLNLRVASSPLAAIVTLLLHRALLAIRGLWYRERSRVSIPEAELMRLDCCSSVTTGLALVNPIYGSDFHTRQLLLALRAGEPNRLARSIAIEIGYQALNGRRSASRRQRLIGISQMLADRARSPVIDGMVAATSGLACYLEQRWRAGLEHSERAERVLRERCAGVTWEIDTAQRVQAICLYHLGEISRLRGLVLRLVREADERGDLYASCGLRAYHANVAWLALDDVTGARREAEDVRARWTQSGYHLQHHYFFVASVQADLYEGKGVVAYERVRAGWRLLSRSLLLRIQLIRIESYALRARAALAAYTESGDAALLAVAEKDARRIARERTEWAVGIASALRAGVVAARGRIDEARALLEKAITNLDESEANAYAAAARCRLAAVKGDSGQLLMEYEFFRRQEVARPPRFVDMLLPGFSRSASAEAHQPAAR